MVAAAASEVVAAPAAGSEVVTAPAAAGSEVRNAPRRWIGVRGGLGHFLLFDHFLLFL